MKLLTVLSLFLASVIGGRALIAQTAEDPVKIVTTFTILADMVENVGGDLVEVISITKPGANIHTYQPTPHDLVAALDAQALIWNGLNLEIWFEQFTNNLGDIPSFTVSEGIEPINVADGDYVGTPNPHAWMGAENAMIYVDNIALVLSHIDPINNEIYRANAEDYKTEIRAAFEPLRALLDDLPEDQRVLVSCEGAFSYLAQELGLDELYMWPINNDQIGTPQQVRTVIDAIRARDIPAVFCESTVSDKPAQQVARETGAHFGGVLYVDSLSPEDGPVPTYLDLLRVTTETIVQGLTIGNTNG